MDIKTVVLLLMPLSLAVSGEMQVYKWGRVFSEEVCLDENFKAQCQDKEIMVIDSAVYGHNIGRCIEVDTGHLGCEADVTEILRKRCDRRQQCQVSLYADQEIKQTEPCQRGILTALKLRYMCLTAIPSTDFCSPVTAKQDIQYISSSQVAGNQCHKSPGIYDFEMTIQAQQGQNIELILVNLNQLISESPISSTELGYILESGSDKVIPIATANKVNSAIGVSESNSISLYLSSVAKVNYLVGFKASGCADLKIHQNVQIEREGSTATVVCNTSPQRWHLTCHGGHWMGVIGNCTSAVAPQKAEDPVVEEWNLSLPKEMVIMIITCATFFLAVVVVTTGCVCLKWPRKKIQGGASQPITFDTISRGTMSASKNQSTGTFKYVPESSRLLVADAEQPIWEQSLPRPPNNDQSTMKANTKRNNEEVYNMSLSSNSTDYERKKYFVLDKDYINANTITLNG